jgi:valyl-tRNA synthetase
MEPRYSPEGVEERWQQAWEAEGLYNADPDPSRPPFAIAHPPPNVTGDLHLGHALQLSLADAIVRTKRMQGFNVLFQPGYDHAGISTQNAVEKHLALEGKTRQDLGREAFEERVWVATRVRRQDHGAVPPDRRLLDYRRERFTMDDLCPRRDAVLVHLWDKGWIYRANGSSTGAPPDLALRPRSRPRRGTMRSPMFGTPRTATAISRSRRCARRPSSVTLPSPCTDDDRYKHLVARGSCRSSSAACP